MSLSTGDINIVPIACTSARWQRIADRMAGAGMVIVGCATLFGLVSGAIIAVVWRADVDWTEYNGPVLVQFGGYMLATVLGMPGLLAGAWDLLRGRPGRGVARMLTFFGPIVILFGVAEGSHLLINCDLTPFICQDGAIYDQWHQLHHCLVAGLPLVLIYWRLWLAAKREIAA